MWQRPFGNTGLTVSAVGLGAGQIGDARLAESDVERLLLGALDLGVTLFDTARGYGLSEERIGKHLAQRRGDFVLSTKVGYSVPGYADWTYDGVRAGVELALKTLRTDYVDIVHLHSCPLETLQRGEVLAALEAARQAGQVRVVAYSGENEALAWAVESGRVGSVEHSLNICDQRVITGALARAQERGLGVIAKRAIANAPWRFAECPKGQYVEEYWWRWKTMQIDPRGLDWAELAVRFAAYQPGVSACIIGTTRLDNLRANVQAAQRGPLADDHIAAIRAAFQQNDPGWWIGQV